MKDNNRMDDHISFVIDARLKDCLILKLGGMPLNRALRNAVISMLKMNMEELDKFTTDDRKAEEEIRTRFIKEFGALDVGQFPEYLKRRAPQRKPQKEKKYKEKDFEDPTGTWAGIVK